MVIVAQNARDITISTGVASLVVIEANPLRYYLCICNDSANTIYVNLGDDAAVANKGIRLNPNGGSLELNQENIWLGRITAIATGATSNLTGIEVSAYVR
jgi:hypothetical protein